MLRRVKDFLTFILWFFISAWAVVVVCLLLLSHNPAYNRDSVISYSPLSTIGANRIEGSENPKLNQAMYEKDFLVLPDYLRESIKEVEYTEENLQEKFSEYFPPSMSLGAVTVGDKIYIDIKSYQHDMFAHEAWHAYDWGHDFMSESEEFVELYDKYYDRIPHSDINPHKEFFACCGALYTLGEGVLPEEIISYFDGIAEN